MLPLRAAQHLERAYYNKSSSSVRNYLFIDTKTQRQAWLLPHTKALIESYDLLRSNRYDSTTPVVAILYRIIEQDSDEDGALSAKDLITLALTTPKGDKYTEVLTEVEQLIDSKVLTEHMLFLVYQKSGGTYSAQVSLSDFTLHNVKPLLALPLQ